MNPVAHPDASVIEGLVSLQRNGVGIVRRPCPWLAESLKLEWPAPALTLTGWADQSAFTHEGP
ncbi:MAG: hypothetical protein ACON39_03200 [Coraliomargaritaceae bacterium]